MKASQNCLEFIEKWEGKENTPYEDVAGLWTVGIGHLVKEGEHFDKLTDAECYELLKNDLAKVEAKLNQWIKVPITQNQYDALCSLCFNIGMDNFRISSVFRFLNQSNYEDAAEAFLLWNKVTKNGAKVVSSGLVNRRKAEMELFLS